MYDDSGNSGSIVINPNTNDTINVYIITLVLSIIGLILVLNHKKFGKILLALTIIFLPTALFGLSILKININFTNIEILGTFDVFNIELDSDNEDDIEPLSIKYGDKIGALPVPSKDGYEFVEWVDEDGNKVDEDTIITEEISLKAKYNIVNYTITYNLDGGNVTNESSYTIEDDVSLSNPVKEGYTFIGWTEGSDTTLIMNVTLMVGTFGNKTYTAHYDANTDTLYTVHHKQMDLNGNYVDYYVEELHGTTGSEVTPEVKSYTGFTSPQEQTITIAPSGDASLDYYYARNRYSIVFDGNEGTGEVSTIELYYGETGVIPANGFTRLNHQFNGWNSAADGSGTSYNIEQEVINLSAENGAVYTIFATWKANPLLTVNVGHGVQSISGTGWTNGNNGSIERYVEPNGTVDLSDINITYKTGYEGIAYSKTSGSGTLNGSSYTVDNNNSTLEISATSLVIPNTPTISGEATSVYNSTAKSVSCATDSVYDSGVTLHYAYGYAGDQLVIPDIDKVELYDEITIGSEKFFIIGIDNENDVIKVIAKHPLINGQSQSDNNPITVPFSNTDYWSAGIGTIYPAYTSSPKPFVYGEQSTLYSYVNNYADKISDILGVEVTGSLISYEEAAVLPFEIRTLTYTSDTTITYWTGSVSSSTSPHVVSNSGNITSNYHKSSSRIRPVLSFSIIKNAKYNDTPVEWSSNVTATTHNVPFEYKGNRFYSCRVYAEDGTLTSDTATSDYNLSAKISYVNARINLDPEGGTMDIDNKFYVEYGNSKMYSSSTKDILISAIPASEKDELEFNGWWTLADGGVQVVDNNLNVIPNVSGWTDSEGNWIRTDYLDSDSNSNILHAQYVEDIKSLYNVLKKNYSKGSLAREYTGAHQDSMDQSKSTEKIYYWYASNTTNAATVLNKNNVLFAGMCWQMIRTTDTGGVRLLYNGEPTITGSGDNITYDCGTSRAGHIGGVKSTQSLSGNYYYGDGYTTSVSGTTTTYTLTNKTQITVNSGNAATTIPTIAANYPYTCRSNNSSGSCTTLYKVDSYSSGANAFVYASTQYRDAIGSTTFNSSNTSISDAGYMYNVKYAASSRSMSTSTSLLSNVTLTASSLTNYGNYYFADEYTMSGNTYVLTNPVKGNEIEDNPTTWAGKYYCQSNSSSSCTTLYYIVAIDTSGESPIIYRFSLSGGKSDDDSSYKYLFGDSIIDNGDGTFEISGNVKEVSIKNWMSEYSTKVNKYVCMPNYYTYDSVNDKYICSDNGAQNVSALKYITAATTTSFTSTVIYKFGFGIAEDNGKYKLVGNNNEDGTLQYIKKWADSATTNCFTNQGDSLSNCGYKTLSKSHYTCFNLSGVCNTYYYINYATSTSSYSITITNGKYVSTDLTDTNNVLYEMLALNNTNSTIKGRIEEWYQNNLLTEYDDFIEDTIYCNNREIKSFGGWDPNGGNTTSSYQLSFVESSPSASNDLSCNNITDRFSVSNDSAKLQYKVGLMRASEMNLLGISNVRATANNYYLLSPSMFSINNQQINTVSPNGTWVGTNATSSFNIRPAISLMPGVLYSSGDGSTTNPYIVDMDSLNN